MIGKIVTFEVTVYLVPLRVVVTRVWNYRKIVWIKSNLLLSITPSCLQTFFSFSKIIIQSFGENIHTNATLADIEIEMHNEVVWIWTFYRISFKCSNLLLNFSDDSLADIIQFKIIYLEIRARTDEEENPCKPNDARRVHRKSYPFRFIEIFGYLKACISQ